MYDFQNCSFSLLFVILSAGDGFRIEYGKSGVDLIHPNRFFSLLQFP